MRTANKFLIAGAGALAIAGVAIAAADKGHVMNVVLPDGSVAHIRYVGDVPPQMVVAPSAQTMPVAFMDADPFAMMDRISYEMDRQMDAMLRQASALAGAGAGMNGQVSDAALKNLPSGAVSYSFTSYSSGNGASCSQSVEVTSFGKGQAPKVERQSQGDCSAMSTAKATPAVQHAPPEPRTLTPASLVKPSSQATPAPKGPII